MAKTLLKLSRMGWRALQVIRYQASKLNMPEVMKQFPFKNRCNCLSLEDEQHGNTSQDVDEVAHVNKEEKKLTKTAETYCSIDSC